MDHVESLGYQRENGVLVSYDVLLKVRERGERRSTKKKPLI
jgi:hypothetical protein